MIKKVFTIIVMFCLFANVSDAETVTKIKIATIDMRKIESESKISNDLEKKMSEKEKEIQQKFLKESKELEKKFKELENKRSILSAQELQKQAQKLEAKYQKFQVDAGFYEKVFEKARMNAFMEIHKNIKKATNTIANKSGYDLIIALDSVLYINSNKFDDITKKTLNKLDQISKTIDYTKIYKDAESEINKTLKRKDAKK